jgi:hypothetical protein
VTYYDKQLEKLQQQVINKKRNESRLKELHAQRENLSDKVNELRKIKWAEEADVKRLEQHSLAAFFYTLIGKKEDKLDQEKIEAYAANVKYEAATHELSMVEEDILRIETELSQERGCELEYENVLTAKKEAIKSSFSLESNDIFQREKRITTLESQKKEINEALSVGRNVLTITEQILSELDSAEGWGTWDLVGGGLITDMVKHSHLDEAQAKVEELQIELRRFKTELTDVTIYADLKVNIDGFLSFADYFFDGLFADWMVLDKINQSQTHVQNTKDQIERVISQLKSMLGSVEKELETEKTSLQRIITKAKL